MKRILFLTLLVVSVCGCKKEFDCGNLSNKNCNELKYYEQTFNQNIVAKLKKNKVEPQCRFVVLGSASKRMKYLDCTKNDDCTFWTDYWKRPFPINQKGLVEMEKFFSSHKEEIEYCGKKLIIPMTEIPTCYPDYEECVDTSCLESKCVIEMK